MNPVNTDRRRDNSANLANQSTGVMAGRIIPCQTTGMTM
jgi:hypothetical protein